jgi:hypothetical protein
VPFHRDFVINIVAAMTSQLLDALAGLTPAALDASNLAQVPADEGVYVLYHANMLVYVGKAADLRKRLGEHQTKIGGRRGIFLSDMAFVCMSVGEGWTALAPESTLITALSSQNAGLCAWNGNGFGPHDPGRDRETTDKPSDGFDATYPIVADWPCSWIDPGNWPILDLLISLKKGLPYLLRYQVSGHWKKGHPDYKSLSVNVLEPNMQAERLLALIANAIPGWQGTVFPSHMILYKESRAYIHGRTL